MVGIAPSTGHFGPGSSEKGRTLEPSKPARRARAALVLLAVTAFIGWNYSTCRKNPTDLSQNEVKVTRLPLSLEHFFGKSVISMMFSQVQQFVGLGLWQQSCFQALYAMSTTSLVGICCCYSLREHRKPVSNLIKKHQSMLTINSQTFNPMYIFITSRAYPPTPSHHVTTPSHYHHPPVDHITEFSYTFFHRQLQIRACFRPKERMWNEWAWHPQGTRTSSNFHFSGATLEIIHSLELTAEHQIIIIIPSERSKFEDTTLPETNIAPENDPLEKEIPIGNHHF